MGLLHKKTTNLLCRRQESRVPVVLTGCFYLGCGLVHTGLAAGGSLCLRTSVLLPLCRPEGPGWVYGSWSGLHFPWLSGQVKMSPLTTLLSGNLSPHVGELLEGRNHVLLISMALHPTQGLAHGTHPTVPTSQGLLSPPMV